MQSDKGFPMCTSKQGPTPSFPIPENIKIPDGKLHIQKIGWLRIQRKGGNSYPNGKPVKVVITKKVGKWYAVVCYEVEVSKNEKKTTAGVDRKVNQIAVVNTDGNSPIYPMPDMARKEARIKRYKRKMARQ